MGVSEMVVNVGNVVTMIYGISIVGRPSFFKKITTSNSFIKKPLVVVISCFSNGFMTLNH